MNFKLGDCGKRCLSCILALTIFISSINLFSQNSGHAFADSVNNVSDMDWQNLPTYTPDADNLGYLDIPLTVDKKTNSNITGASVTKTEMDNSYPEPDHSYDEVESSFGENFRQDFEEYYITSLEDLKEFRDRVNGTGYARYSFKGKTVYLTTDINLSAEEWVPIGRPRTNQLQDNINYTTEYYSFCGTFDGLNHKIYNLNISDSSTVGAGFFGGFGGYGEYRDGALIGATVKNIHIVDCNIKGSIYVGGIVGFTRMTNDISNCTVSGNISGDVYVGGIVGGGACYLIGTSQYGWLNLSNCNIVNKSDSATTQVSGYYGIGGIVGYQQAGHIAADSLALNVDVAGISAVGGIAGILGLSEFKSGGLSTKYTTYDINGYTITGKVFYSDDINLNNPLADYLPDEISIGKYIGGVVGYSEIAGIYDEPVNPSVYLIPVPFNTYDLPDYKSLSSSAYDSDGDTGYDSIRHFENIFIDNQVYGIDYVGTVGGKIFGNICNVNVSVDNINTTQNSSYVGTIAGYFGAAYEDSFTNVTIRSSNNSINISGSNYIGGLFGYMRTTFLYKSSWYHFANIIERKSYYPAYRIKFNNINTTLNFNISGNDYIGGIAGYATGIYDLSEALISSELNVNIKGHKYVGGIAGYFIGANTVYGPLMPNTAFTFNNIIVSGKVEGSDYVGGFFGYYIDGESTLSSAYSTEDFTKQPNSIVGSQILNCMNTATIVGDNNVGGIVGHLVSTGYSWISRRSDSGYDVRARITECINKGVIQGKITNIGGIVGFNDAGVIERCYNKGNIESSADCTGGIIGTSSGLSYPRNETLITDEPVYLMYVSVKYPQGGMALITHDLPEDIPVPVTASIQEASTELYDSYYEIRRSPKYTVIATDDTCIEFIDLNSLYRTFIFSVPDISECRNDGYIKGNNYTGGIVGKADDVIGPVTATTEVNNILGYGIDKNINNGEILGNDNVGGIAGYITERLTTRYLRNLANVSGHDNVGGIIGHMDKITSVQESFNIADVYGNDCVGGIVGYATYGDIENMIDGIVGEGFKTSANNNYFDWWVYGINSGYSISLLSSSRLSKTFVTAKISNIYNTGAIEGCSRTGGILGGTETEGQKFVFKVYSDSYEYSEVTVTYSNISTDHGYNTGAVKNVNLGTIGYLLGGVSLDTNASFLYISEDITDDLSECGDYYIDLDPFSSNYPVISNYELAMTLSGTNNSKNSIWINTPKHQTKLGTLPSQRPMLNNNREVTAELYPLPLIENVVDYDSWRDFWVSLYSNYSNYGNAWVNPRGTGTNNYDYYSTLIDYPELGITTTLNWTPYDENEGKIGKDPKIRQFSTNNHASSSWFFKKTSYPTGHYQWHNIGTGYSGVLEGNNKTIAFYAGDSEYEDRLISGSYYLDNPDIYPLYGVGLNRDCRHLVTQTSSNAVIRNLTIIDGSPICYEGAYGLGTNYGILENIITYNRGLASNNYGTIINCGSYSPRGYWSDKTDLNSMLNYSTWSLSAIGYNDGIVKNCFAENGALITYSYGHEPNVWNNENNSYSYYLDNPMISNSYSTGFPLITCNSSYPCFIENCYTINAPYFIGRFDKGYGWVRNCFLYNEPSYDITAVTTDVSYPRFIQTYGYGSGSYTGMYYMQRRMGNGYGREDPTEYIDGCVLNCYTNNIIKGMPGSTSATLWNGYYYPMCDLKETANSQFMDGSIAYQLYMYNKDVIHTPDEENIWGQFIAESRDIQNPDYSFDEHPVFNHPRVHKVEFDWTNFNKDEEELSSAGNTVLTRYVTQGRRLTVPSNVTIGASASDNIIWTNSADNTVFDSSVRVYADTLAVPNLTVAAILKYSALGSDAKITQPTETENGRMELWVDISKKVESFIPDNINYVGDNLTPGSDIQVSTTNLPTYTVSAIDAAGEEITLSYDLELHWLGLTYYDIPDDDTDEVWEGEIDQENNIIRVRIPKPKAPKSKVVPNTQGEGTILTDDFDPDDDTPPTVTVTAPDGFETEKIYTVVIEYVDEPLEIIEYTILGTEGIIKEDEILVRLPVSIKDEVDIESVVPDSIIYEATSITPGETEAINLTDDVVYTLTNSDGSQTREYDLVIEWYDDILRIEKYILLDAVGVIDDGTNQITVRLPISKKSTVDITSVVPDYIKYVADKIDPLDTSAINLEDEIKYTLYNEDEIKTRIYDLVIEWYDDTVITDLRLIRYKLLGYEGVIRDSDGTHGTITVEIPLVEKPADISAIVPDAVEYLAERISPSTTDAIDLRIANFYTLYDDTNNKTKTYELIIKWVGPPAEVDLRIIKYKLLGYYGHINEEDSTILIDIPLSAKKSSFAVPDELEYIADKITPTPVTAIDLDNEVVYTLKTEDESASRDYTLVINWINDTVSPSTPELRIIRYKLYGYEGVIRDVDDTNGTITVDIPLVKPADVTSIVPDAIEYIADSISPDVTEAINLNDKVIYTLTDEETGIQKTYELTVNWTGVPQRLDLRIIKFKLLGHYGHIDHDKGTITVELSISEDPNAPVVPDELEYIADTITPSASTAIDLTKKVIYILTDNNYEDTKSYELIINWVPEDDDEEPDEPPITDDRKPDEPGNSPDTGVGFGGLVALCTISASLAFTLRRRIRR